MHKTEIYCHICCAIYTEATHQQSRLYSTDYSRISVC